MLGHRNATGSTHRYTKPDKPAADRLVDALGRPEASAAPSAAAAIVVAPPAPPPDALDSTEPCDYSSVPPREGGGIGRRTSLRCLERRTAEAKEGPPGLLASVEGCLAYGLALAAEAGRWDIVSQLGRALEARRSG